MPAIRKAEVAVNSRIVFVPIMTMFLTWLSETVAVPGVDGGCTVMIWIDRLRLRIRVIIHPF